MQSSGVLLLAIAGSALGSAVLEAPPVFAALPPAPAPIDNAVSCNATKLKSCLNTFYEEIGFSGHTVQDFINYVKQYIEKDPQHNFPATCNTLRSVMKLPVCLGSQFNACFAPSNLVKQLGLSNRDAGMMNSFGFTLGFECNTPGIEQTLVRNARCIFAAERSHAGQEARCQRDFEQASARDPAHQCRYLQIYQQCVVDIYQQCGEEVQATMCRIYQAAFHHALPVCTTVCPSVTCNADRLKGCLNAFYQGIGFSGDTVQDFINYVTSYVAQDPQDNFPKTCRIQRPRGKELRNVMGLPVCLGPQFNACFAPSNLVQQLGLSNRDAGMMNSFGFALGFECTTPGVEQTLIANAECIFPADQSGAAKKAQCLQDFETQSAADPARTCSLAQTYQECLISIYGECGRDVEVAMCQVFQATLHHNLPACTTVCPSPVA